ncbi:MAG: methionine--tRNA ligase [Bacteroidota bacterium]
METTASRIKRHTVTAALPYANGPVHIGHLAGVYVPADIFVRFMRSKGKPVLFVCGSDEHGVPITLRARAEGTTPQEVVDKYHTQIRDSFKDFGIAFDIYSRTGNATHHKTASDFFLKLYEEGKLDTKTEEQFYDAEAKMFLADRYIQGTCPNCGNPNAYGDQCEKCGTSLSPDELLEPKSMLSGAVPEKRPTKHWYLPLDRHENWLREWILQDHKEWKTNVYGQCKSWLDQGLHPRAVTRDLEWGVKLPIPDSEGKVLYVWFDAPIGYISATADWAAQNGQDWEPWWKDADTRLLHFIGKDNIVFHCIIFPAMLREHGEFILPDNVPANEFLNLEGNKISTSRNWAVWLHEYLEDFPGCQDVLRYVLCATAPETKDNDFTWKDFQTRNNSELVGIFGNFINRALVLTHKYFEGKVPAAGAQGQAEQDLEAVINAAPNAIAESVETFRFREALSRLVELARAGNKYLAETEPWKLANSDLARTGAILNLALQVAANLSVLAEPFLPQTAAKLRKMLNLSLTDWHVAGTTSLLAEGHQLNAPELLFRKIEDSEVTAQVEKLHASKAALNPVPDTEKPALADTVIPADKNLSSAGFANTGNTGTETIAAESPVNTWQPAPAKPAITFDDFQRMDIRVATVLEAESVPKSKKLLKLKLDTGLDIRTVMSGIAEHFKPEEVLGRQVCILANLEPRNIMGVASQGMILMADNGAGGLAFMQPGSLTAPGGTVS